MTSQPSPHERPVDSPARPSADVALPATYGARGRRSRILVVASAAALTYVFARHVPQRWSHPTGDDALLRAVMYAVYLPVFLIALVPAWWCAWRRSDLRRPPRPSGVSFALCALPAILLLVGATGMQLELHHYVPNGRGGDDRVFGPPFSFDFDEWWPAAVPLVPALLAMLLVRRRPATSAVPAAATSPVSQ